MDSFKRVFKYIWPQWPRLVGIVCSAFVIGLLFAFSIATILPLLKVMMGEEGLHGWVDRKICEGRYQLRFHYEPDVPEVFDPNRTARTDYIQVSQVERDGPAQKAGLKPNDLIIGVGPALNERASSTVLLKDLAQAETGSPIEIKCVRNLSEEVPLLILPGARPFYSDFAQWAVGFLPTDQTRESTKTAVMAIIVLMLITTAARCAARFVQVYLVHKLMNITLAQLREDAFRHSLDISAGFFDSEGANDTVSRLVRDTASIGTGIKVLLGKTLREPFKAMSLMGVALWIEPKMTLIFICGAPMALFAIGKLGKKIKRATKKSLVAWSLILGKLKEALGGIKVIKVYNRQEHECSSFSVVNRRLLRQQLRIAKIDASTGPIMETLGMLAGSVGLLFGAHWVFKGKMFASDFFTLLVCLGATAESVRKVSDVWNKLQQANAGAERVFEVVDEKPEFEDADAFELASLQRKIEFKDIVFSYPSSENPVLKNVNLTVEAGHNIAIVGPNGSGKTTLANLIPRLYDPDSGQILIDGQNIRHATLFSLRSQIGLVTQNVTTFNDTVAANIGYGKSDATREEIIAAAQRSFAHEFIDPLPEGYDTVIGEQGAGLSGGQLQRIVIARAILKNPAILIFDEATSQVDADSEAKIHKAIEEIMRDRTSFIIAHRFSTVISADVIVVMDQGEIIAEGQHSELIKSCPLYQSLYETQLVKE